VLTDRELTEAVGTTAYDAGGDEVGTVEHFFVDDRTGAPTWVAVKSGLFGTRHAIVPALDARFADGALRLPVTREAVRSAPQLLVDRHLEPGEEETLRRHYGLGDAVAAPSDGAMTRSEERLRVSTESVAATRVRVVKYVVTEQVQLTVPVRREEIRVEEVPLDAPDTGPGESLVPQEHTAQGLPEEIVLHREEPVISMRVVPAERVRLRTEAVAGRERVSAQVQRERIVVEGPPAPHHSQARGGPRQGA
jgi:uncharacterized protein (TIGR02271 family)